jgi:hypothetical protein
LPQAILVSSQLNESRVRSEKEVLLFQMFINIYRDHALEIGPGGETHQAFFVIVK